MTPQRPRPPQADRTAGPRRPAAPRPAPPRTATGSDGGSTDGTPTGGAARQARATDPTRTAPTTPRPPAAPGATTPPAGAPRAPRRTTGSARSTTSPVPSAPAAGSTLAPSRGSVFPVRPPVVSQGSVARFAERARARRRMAWRQILLTVGGVLLAGVLAWALLFSPLLALDAEQVEVSGAGTVVAVDQVRAVVDAEAGVPLTRLDTAALRTALLDVPGVRDVTVTRDWPHGLTVALESREPVAAVPESTDVAQQAEGAADGAEGTGYALVDQDGVQVGRADAPPEGLPVVQVPVGEARILTSTLGVLESLPADLLAAIGQVSASSQDTVQLVLRDGAVVEWGSDQDSALKVAVLQALRAAPETAGAARYDVTAPTMPVVG